MTAQQWARAAAHIAGVSELGVRFSGAWAATRLTPYIHTRFALEAACLAAAEDEHEFRYDDVWAKLFSAAPKGHSYRLDAGAAAAVARYYEKWRDFSFDAMRLDRRRKTDSEAPALLAAEAAYAWAARGRPAIDAPARAAAALVEQKIWPEDGPLPWWPVPRERADGDWLIGALARLRRALKRSLALLEAADAFDRKWREALSDRLRGDAGALNALAVAAGSPALTQGAVVEIFGLSKKAAQKAIATLEDAGAVIEITGRSDWRVWLANDLALSAPLANLDLYAAGPATENPFVSLPKPSRPKLSDPIDVEWRDADLKQAMDEADAASGRLAKMVAKLSG